MNPEIDTAHMRLVNARAAYSKATTAFAVRCEATLSRQGWSDEQRLNAMRRHLADLLEVRGERDAAGRAYQDLRDTRVAGGQR